MKKSTIFFVIATIIGIVGTYFIIREKMTPEPETDIEIEDEDPETYPEPRPAKRGRPARNAEPTAVTEEPPLTVIHGDGTEQTE